MTTEFLLMVETKKLISHVMAMAQGKQVITRVVFHTYRNMCILVGVITDLLSTGAISDGGTGTATESTEQVGEIGILGAL